MRLPKLGIGFISTAMALAMAIVPVARAQQTKETPKTAMAAPLPEQLATATSVFISNGGSDTFAIDILKREGNPYQPYNEFYAAMKTWGRYQLATSPMHADLILEMRFTAPISGCGKTASYAPQMELTILDGKTHFVLWTIDESVEIAVRIATWERNINEGVTNIVGDLQRLVAKPIDTTTTGGQK